MEQFENVEQMKRYCPDIGGMEIDVEGGWVTFSDYNDLLSAYKELKHRTEELEK